MKLQATCFYCNHKWNTSFSASSVDLSCPVCNDTNILVKDLAKTVIDYYAGSPPFPDLELENYQKVDSVETIPTPAENPFYHDYYDGGVD